MNCESSRYHAGFQEIDKGKGRGNFFCRSSKQTNKKNFLKQLQVGSRMNMDQLGYLWSDIRLRDVICPTCSDAWSYPSIHHILIRAESAYF